MSKVTATGGEHLAPIEKQELKRVKPYIPELPPSPCRPCASAFLKSPIVWMLVTQRAGERGARPGYYCDHHLPEKHREEAGAILARLEAFRRENVPPELTP